MTSTTSCEVGPAGLSIRMAPSSGENSCMAASGGGIQRPLDGGDHPPLRRQWRARYSCAGRHRVAAPVELRGDLIHVHLVALRAQTHAGQVRFHFLEDTRYYHRGDGADMVNQALRI